MKLSEESKKRYDAFWENKAIDRFLMNLSSVKYKDYRPEGMTDEQWNEYKWDNVDFRAECSFDINSKKKYYLDGFGCEFINYGPGSLAASIGSDFRYMGDTVWFGSEPIIKDWDNYPEIKFDKDSLIWKKTMEYTDKIIDKGICASVADLGGMVDIAASLRGSQELLFDMYDYPEKVKELIDAIRKCWIEAFIIQTDRIFERQEGMISWMPVWCREKYSPIQCDFSAMISPDMFDEFVLPDLKELCNFLPKSIYHLDGEEEFVHLDSILSIPNLNVVQWSPPAGEYAEDEKWFDMYDRVQSAGKGLLLYLKRGDMVEKLLKHLSPNGVFMQMCTEDDNEAKYVADMVEKMGLKK